MKQRIMITLLTLSLLLGLVLWSAPPLRPAAAPAMYPLDPADNTNFPSLGASPFGTAGTYTIKASKNNSTCAGARTYTMIVP